MAERVHDEVSAVVVTFNPVLAEIEDLLRRLVPELRSVIVVDNSGPAQADAVRAAVDRAGARYLGGLGNTGIAAAQNRGLREAARLGATAMLLLDDDSSMEADDVGRLLEFLRSSRAEDATVAAVAPRIVDSRTGDELNPVLRHGRLRFEALTEVSDAAFLLGSGTLLHVDALARHGYLRDEYFIDHVDREWGYRVRHQGGRLLITPDVVLRHRLGEDPVHRNGRWVAYAQSNPARHYYMTRNSLLLMRDVPLPPRQRLLETAEFGRFLIRRLLSPEQPLAVKRAVVVGLLAGLSGRRSPEVPLAAMARPRRVAPPPPA